LKRRDLKHFLETLAAVAAVIGPAAGWLDAKFERYADKLAEHDRQLARLNLQVFGITYFEPPPAGPRLLQPESSPILAFPVPFLVSPTKKESPDER
jgi:hypothetical protein